MIHGRGQANEANATCDASEQYLSLLIAIEAAVSTGAPETLDPRLLAELNCDERARLAEARECLHALYRTIQHERSNSFASATTIALDAAGLEKALENARVDAAFLDAGTGIDKHKIGRFEIVREIAQGGHGLVLLARDPALKRLVALKVPLPEVLVASGMRQRFLAEGRATALLAHPNIVTVYEAGEIGPICYLAQEFISGPTLSEWLSRQLSPPAPRTAAAIVAQLADGVEHAHNRGILHRDLKPGNVLLASGCDRANATKSESDGEGLPFVPKISDFGIAKPMAFDGSQTVTGTILGTPAYMSPEQAAGHRGRVKPASDVYGLGTILYELLTLRPAFRGETFVDTIRLVTTTDVVRPRALRADVPQDLEAICLKCLEKDADRRYSTAFAFAADLRQFLANRPTVARPIRTSERIVRWCRRKPSLAGLIAVSCAALVVLVLNILWSNRRLADSLAIAEKERLRAEHNEEVARRYLGVAKNRAYAADLRLVAQSWRNSSTPAMNAILQAYVPSGDEADLRGFEWWLDDKLLNDDTPSKMVGRHEGGVQSVAVSPKGDIAASGGTDGVIRLWRLPSGDSAGELRGHTPGDISGLAFSPDGSRLASAGDDKTVRIWDVALGKEVHCLQGHTDWVACVAFLPDGKTLVSGAADKLIFVWDAEAGKELRRLQGHTDTVRTLAYHVPSSVLFSAAEDATVRAWNVATGLPAANVPEGKLKNPSDRWIRCLAIEPDQSTLLGVPFGDEPIWWTLDGYRIRELEIGKGARSASIQGPNEHPIVAFGLEDSFVRVSTLGTQEAKSDFRTLRGHANVVRAVALNRDATRLLSGSQDGEVRLWDLSREPSAVRGRAIAEKIGRVAISPNGELIAIARQDGRLLLLNFEDLQPLRTFSFDGGKDFQIAFSPDSKSMALVADEQPLKLFTCEGAVRQISDLKFQQPGELQYSSDGRLVAAATKSAVVIIDINTSAVLCELAHPQNVRNVTFLDQDRILTSCVDGCLRTWSVPAGQELSSELIQRDGIGPVALTADGQYALVGSFQRVDVIALESHRIVASIPHEGDVRCIQFLGRGCSLMTADRAATPHLWQNETWQDLGPFDAQDLVNLSICASTDGMRVVVYNHEKLRVFDARARHNETLTTR